MKFAFASFYRRSRWSVGAGISERLLQEVMGEGRVGLIVFEKAQEMKNSTIAWLIDDDGLANFLTEKTLKLSQFATQTFTFTTIEGALYFLSRAVEGGTVDFPDYIFLDINMPGLDGWHFLDSFAELPEELKGKCSLYMLSSSIDKGDRLRTEQHKGACGFISKPLSEEDLENIKHQRTSHK